MSHRYSIRPSTVLVTELDTGAFIVQDPGTSASAYISPADSVPLRAALDTAFGARGREMNLPPIVKPRI